MFSGPGIKLQKHTSVQIRPCIQNRINSLNSEQDLNPTHVYGKHIGLVTRMKLCVYYLFYIKDYIILYFLGLTVMVFLMCLDFTIYSSLGIHFNIY